MLTVYSYLTYKAKTSAKPTSKIEQTQIRKPSITFVNHIHLNHFHFQLLANKKQIWMYVSICNSYVRLGTLSCCHPSNKQTLVFREGHSIYSNLEALRTGQGQRTIQCPWHTPHNSAVSETHRSSRSRLNKERIVS